MNILIADDDPVSRTLLERVLHRSGYEVTAVGNGRLAAEYLCQPAGPRLALLDWEMPYIDGPTVCRQIRSQEDHPYVYALLLTSKDSKQDLVVGLDAGADDFLTKPFDPAELKARLRTGERVLRLEDKLVEGREQMRFQATHDALTGIWNRRAMMDTLERELSSLRRERAPMTIMLGDLDHFKEIDDAHGHLVGDEVLREVARRLKLSVRPYDFVGRYGAEEFLMVLLNCGQAEALGRAEEARKLVVNDRVQTAAGPLRVTISLGVAVVCDCPDQLEKILSAVDLALYQAKAGGRDCVRLATAGDLLAPTSPMIHRVPSPDK